MIACAAQAARLWKGIDDSFADKCLKNAEASWKAVMAKESKWAIKKGNWETDPQFAPLDQAIGGGGYGDTYVEDDAYWAACELFSTTGDDQYYSYLSKYKNKNDGDGHDKAFDITCSLGGGENNGSFSSFNWGCTAGLGTLTSSSATRLLLLIRLQSRRTFRQLLIHTSTSRTAHPTVWVFLTRELSSLMLSISVMRSLRVMSGVQTHS
jgi:hypothetical protein